MSTSLQINSIDFELQVFDRDFILMKPLEAHSDLHLMGKAIYKENLQFVEEVICTETEICLKLNEKFTTDSIETLQAVNPTTNSIAREYKLPILINRESSDWAEIESVSGLTSNQYIQQVLSSSFMVSMLGFLPGFLYMKGLEKHLHIPRKKTPSKKVKRGSIGIGGPYLGLYSLESPGGWNIIGETPLKILNTTAIPLLDLEPGDKIKLKEISQQTFSALENNPITIEEYNGLL